MKTLMIDDYFSGKESFCLCKMMTVSQFSQHTSGFTYLFKVDHNKVVCRDDFHPTQIHQITLLCVYN